MRILYFSQTYTPHDFRFLSSLSKTEHEITYLPLEGNSKARESRPIPTGVQLAKFENGNGGVNFLDRVRSRPELSKLLEELNPDLVHAGPVQKGAFLTARTGFTPLLTMSWGSDMLLDAKSGFGSWAARYTLKRSVLFLCDCEVVAQTAREMGMSDDRIVIFPWGVDLAHFSSEDGKELRKNLGWEDAFVLLSTREFEPIYGVEILLEAFANSLRIDQHIRLLLLGDGSLRSKFEHMVAEKGIGKVVHFAGRIRFEELPSYFHAADLYLSASRVDGSSISLLQAMASGLPSLVSNIPGNKEWVQEGVNGWHFADGNDVSLSHKLETIAHHSDLLARYGIAARAIAERRADWNANFSQLLGAYKRAISLSGDLG